MLTEQVIEEIKFLTAEQVIDEITKLKPEISKETLDEVEDICYDRQLCKQLNVDYCTIANTDYNKIVLGVLMCQQKKSLSNRE